MGIWDFYFIAKLFLYFTHHMDFHVAENLAFAAFLLVSVQQPRLQPLRKVIAIPIGIALLYYDSWFPPVTRLISGASQVQAFDSAYVLELASRLIHVPTLVALAGLYAVCHFARKKFRVSSFVVVAMLVPLWANVGGAAPAIPGQDHQPANSPAAALERFYKTEADRTVKFSAADSQDIPFDIIFLHICSLSWDDLDFAKERDHPLFKRFDIVFTRFNSAASYSGPSAIRLLRGSCGQQQHGRLYDPVNAQCQTFNVLQRIGFDPQLALNHDGLYGNFLADIRERGGLKAVPFNNEGTPPYLKSFDGTVVSADYDVLSMWWANRLTLPEQRVALYYNSISLHDGNQYAEKRSTSSLEIYPPRLTRLLGDLDRFFKVVEASGRRAVVVFVPEHGAAIRGDTMQIAGMREFPVPAISIVPAGIKLINLAAHPEAKPVIVSTPSSYLALSQLLSDFIRTNPFGSEKHGMEHYVRNLPVTEYVAENEDIVVMQHDNRFYMRSRSQAWTEYVPLKTGQNLE